MSTHTMKRESEERCRRRRDSTSERGTPFFIVGTGLIVAALWAAPAQGQVVYTETFDGPSVPANWIAQDGSQGPGFIEIADDAAGIGGGNALSITSFTRQGIIGSFDQVSFMNVGDTIEVSFDVRLTSFPNNPGGFRFGLYHDNGGPPALSSGYRTFIGTGTSLRTTVQADGGDNVEGDILFGTNRENPPGFEISGVGAGSINNDDAHSFLLSMTRTVDGVRLEPFQNGVSILPETTEHIPGTGAGMATPVQTRFNQVAFSSNEGIVGLVDNIQVEFIAGDDPPPILVGDYNGDDVVDAADYTVWRDNLGGSGLPNDSTPEVVDQSDYTKWFNQFGASSGGAAAVAAVPEPDAWLLLVFGTMGLGVWRIRSFYVASIEA